MSIWATSFGLANDPAGLPRLYRGSHIVPTPDDPRDDEDVQLAEIPFHVTRDDRDDAPEDGRPWPWARLSVGVEDVVIDPAQARALAAALTAWADHADPGQPPQ